MLILKNRTNPTNNEWKQFISMYFIFLSCKRKLVLSYRAVYYAQVLRYWCPAGAPGSLCGKDAEWSPSWRRSRCPPRPPPCGTPPFPLPDGPPAVSGWQNRTDRHDWINSHNKFMLSVTIVTLVLSKCSSHERCMHTINTTTFQKCHNEEFKNSWI